MKFSGEGKPNNDTALCLAASTKNGLWFSLSCYVFKPYICKQPAVQASNCSPCSTTAPQKTCPSRINVTWPQTTSPSTSATLTCSCHPEIQPTRATPAASLLCDSGWTYSHATKDCWMVRIDRPEVVSVSK